MTATLKVALAQLNPIVGDIAGNADGLRAARNTARGQGAEVVVGGELGLIGYPPEDLVRRPTLVAAARTAAEALAAETADDGPAMIVGLPWVEDGELYNSVAVLDGGEIVAVRHKVLLPNYGVFDEKRLFSPGPMPAPVDLRGWRLGLPICEDIWDEGPAEALCAAGAQVLLVPNGSPFETEKHTRRIDIARARAQSCGRPLLYVNQVGGQDEVVFDGASFILGPDGKLAGQMTAWAEDVQVAELFEAGGAVEIAAAPRGRVPEGLEAIYRAMVLGLRDYVDKNGFPGVVLGLSGGIDSGLSVVVAVDALGPDRVRAVMMPSRYTSADSLEDAALGAKRLGIRLDEVGIEPAVAAFGDMLAPIFQGKDPDLAEENIQSRIRGLILMGISNKFGPMVLTTGNKSEMSVGYATLYGDMCGGYSVLKDVYKTDVFDLARWRNATVPEGALGPGGEVVPQRVIDKPPTAELRADQKDSDSLPDYPELDAILEGLVEDERPAAELIADGFDPATVKRIEHLLYIAEYKRRQAPPGVKIGRRNFGRDRRYPITNRFRDGV